MKSLEFFLFSVCPSAHKTGLLLSLLMALIPVQSLSAPNLVKRNFNQHPGSLVIETSTRKLFLVVNETQALAYRVAVPKQDKDWFGYARIVGKHWMPSWTPPELVRRDFPNLPSLIPGGHPSNPMGVAAILLDRPEIAIHGTTSAMRKSIGTAASYGCIRMRNEDISDLFQRVNTNTLVVKIP